MPPSEEGGFAEGALAPAEHQRHELKESSRHYNPALGVQAQPGGLLFFTWVGGVTASGPIYPLENQLRNYKVLTELV